jgi:hypothetical protein
VNDPFVAIISAGRPQNVPAMDALVDLPHVWIVPQGQAEDYRYAGADKVMETPSTQDTHQRNFALDVAGSRWCVQMDDDLQKLRYCVPGEKGQPITVSLAIGMMVAAAEDLGAFYAGIAPTDNAYFTRTAFNTTGFIRSAFTVYRPGSQLRYDHQFPLKGDYDLTCQHLAKYGRVARVDGLLGSFKFGQGSGGCVAYRTPVLEEMVIGKLMAKWPGIITPNTKRPGEVLLRWKVPDEVAVAQMGFQ